MKKEFGVGDIGKWRQDWNAVVDLRSEPFQNKRHIMRMEYRIQPVGTAFIVIDSNGETVDTYPTEEAANRDIERCKKEDAMYETAQQLFDMAIKTHMEKFGATGKESHYWIRCASEGI